MNDYYINKVDWSDENNYTLARVKDFHVNYESLLDLDLGLPNKEWSLSIEPSNSSLSSDPVFSKLVSSCNSPSSDETMSFDSYLNELIPPLANWGIPVDDCMDVCGPQPANLAIPVDDCFDACNSALMNKLFQELDSINRQEPTLSETSTLSDSPTDPVGSKEGILQDFQQSGLEHNRYQENLIEFDQSADIKSDVDVKPDIVQINWLNIRPQQPNERKLKPKDKLILRNAVKRLLIFKAKVRYFSRIHNLQEKINAQNQKNLLQQSASKFRKEAISIQIEKLKEQISNLEKQFGFANKKREVEGLEKKILELLKTPDASPIEGNKLRDEVKRLRAEIADHQEKIRTRKLKLNNLQKKDQGILTYSTKIEQIRKQIETLNDFDNPLHERLFHDKSLVLNDPIDFQKIVLEDFCFARNAPASSLFEEVTILHTYWENFLRPDIKTGKMSTEEVKFLKALVPTLGEGDVNWSQIADNLAVATNSKYQRTVKQINEFCSRLKNDLFGWTDEDDSKFRKSVETHLINVHPSEKKFAWARIVAEFPGRTKTQLYSHFRYISNISQCNRAPYSRAEDEVIRTGISLDLSFSQVAQLLGHNRTAHQVESRRKYLQVLTEGEQLGALLKERIAMETSDDDKTLQGEKVPDGSLPETPSTKLDKQQIVFGKKLQILLEKYGFPERLFNERDPGMIEIPLQLVDETLELINGDPDLVIGKIIKPKGKPGRKKKVVGLTDQLQELIRPMSIIKNRRKRITSLPGDGRDHGLVLCTLHRLLGIDFDRTKTPSVNSSSDELLEAGISKPDHMSYQTMMEMVDSLPEGQSEAESKHYLAGDFSPPESLLPPTLHTLNGLRGLLVYQDSLKTQAEAEEENNKKHRFGDENADRRLYYLLESLFHWTGRLETSQSNN